MMSTFTGLRPTGLAGSATDGLSGVSRAPVLHRGAVWTRSDKKVTKRTDVVLMAPVKGLGKPGELESVRNGYYRNFLLPNGLAKLADVSVLAAIKAKEQAEEAAARKLLDEANALATALQTIGKFTVRVKVGEEKRIFGSVSAENVVDAIFAQTNRRFEKSAVIMPDDIKLTGTYDVSLRLHPKVLAKVLLLVQKQ